MNHRPAHVHDPMQMASAVHAYAQFQQFQQPYFYLMGYPTTSAFADRRQAHPHLQSPQVQVAYQHNLFQGQMPVDGVPTPHEPALQASGWLQPFNESELKVAGILPYSYGMPRYGQVGLHLMPLVQLETETTDLVLIHPATFPPGRRRHDQQAQPLRPRLPVWLLQDRPLSTLSVSSSVIRSSISWLQL